MPTTRSAKIAPIRAYCSRFSGDESGLAPMSSSTNGLPSRTIWTASAGRSTPGNRPIRSTAAAIAAPVCPAVMTASARPSFTRSQRDRDRRVLLLAERHGRMLVHLDDLARGDDLDVRRQVAFDGGNAGRVADEEDRVLGMGAGVIERAGNDLRRDRGHRPWHRPLVGRRRESHAMLRGPRRRPASHRPEDRIRGSWRRSWRPRYWVVGVSSFGALISSTGRPP